MGAFGASDGLVRRRASCHRARPQLGAPRSSRAPGKLSARGGHVPPSPRLTGGDREGRRAAAMFSTSRSCGPRSAPLRVRPLMLPSWPPLGHGRGHGPGLGHGQATIALGESAPAA